MPVNMKVKGILMLSAFAFGATASVAVAQDNPIDAITPVTDEMLLNPPDGDWLMWRRTYDGWGYSPLDQINKENVGDLRLAWAWAMTPGRTQETPLAHDGIVFIQNSDAVIQALDGATGDLIWEYEYDLPDDADIRGVRNKAIYDNMLIVATRHAHLFALDIRTGDLVWDKQVANYQFGYGFSSGPIVANGVIVQGTTGCGGGQPGAASSPATIPIPARNSGASTPSPAATRPRAAAGTACRWKAGMAPRPGSPAPTTPSRT